MSIYTRHFVTQETPAEYAADNFETCAQCMVEVDLDEDQYTDLDELYTSGPQKGHTKILCKDCRTLCAGPKCLEWISSPTRSINMRCQFTGKRELWHPECAAAEWIARLDEHFTDDHEGVRIPDDPNKEVIASLYAYYAGGAL
jgi:hypothetical protein